MMPVWLLAAAMTACAVPVQHQVTAPQVDQLLAHLPKPCPPLMPIPAVMHIEIDGRDVTVDPEGDAFLRRYVSARDCLRGAR